jgi:hypothetical protein
MVRFPYRHLSFAPLLTLISLLAAPACDDGAPTTSVLTPAAATGLAIVSSDFVKASVSLYDPVTGGVRDDCLHSASSVAQPLSGDVTLPSQPQIGGELVVIDRGGAVLSFVRPTDCQLRTQLSVAPNGYNGNPHDVVVLSPTKAYVTRYARNLADTPGEMEKGEDILIVDPSTPTPAVVGRIDLRDQATSPDVEARPDRAVLAEGKVYVSLGNISTDYKTTGAGRIAVIDPASDAVAGVIDLPDQRDCSALEYLAPSKMLWISCGVPSDDAAAASALVEIDLSGAMPRIARTVRADALGTQPFNFAVVTPAAGLVFGVTLGSFTNPVSDALYAIPLGGGATPMKIMDGGAFNIGRTALALTGTKLLVPDGDVVMPRVRLFDVAGGTATAAGDFLANPAGMLPPREVGRY